MTFIIRFIFFGNIFYGLCAVALAMEASLQQSYPLNDLLFYVLVFLVTVLYYNVAYITEKPSPAHHPRSRWYADHLGFIKWLHLALTLLFVSLIVYSLDRHWVVLLQLPVDVWLVLFSFPLAASLYYGINHRAVGRFSLRNVGWLKPFIIGFSWAGLVTIIPIVYHQITQGGVFSFSLLMVLLFIKNFMFISLLSILFDIKDYATDSNLQLKTYVVKNGLRKTIFYFIIPLTVLGLGSFLVYGLLHVFSIPKLLLNTVPFLLLVWVARSLQRRRSIFYYLVIIDGLMLTKALCGIVASTFY